MKTSQSQHKQLEDKKFRKPHLNIGDKVWVKVYPHSQASKSRTSKFMPRRDGSYIISSHRSSVSYTLTSNDNSTPIGTYHASIPHPVYRTWSHTTEFPASQRMSQEELSSSAERATNCCNFTKTSTELERKAPCPIPESKLHTEDDVYSLREIVKNWNFYHKYFFPPAL